MLEHEGPRNNIPEVPVAADVAIGMGYTESKWVSEQILDRVGKETQLKPLTVRVGQLCGGTNGCWNKNEWFPSMVHSALVAQCLPTEDKVRICFGYFVSLIIQKAVIM